MPGTEATTKDVINTGNDIEKESETVSTDIDNTVKEEVGTLDNQVDIEKDDKSDDDTKEEKEEEAVNGTVPEIQVDGNTIRTTEGGISKNVDQELGSGETTDTSGIELTDEEKNASGEIKKDPSEIFGSKTGATKILDEGKEDSTQQEELNKEESGPQEDKNNVFDANTGAGEVMKISKPKKVLFSAILGLKKATKGIGNFFKKKVPKAFKTGGEAALKVLRKTPVAPLVDLLDDAIKYREKTRPEREEKARQKKEKWLLDQDEKRRKKEEQERIKKEKAELEAQYKASLWELKKKSNSLDYRAHTFFKGIWDKIKTGATKVAKKVKDSKVGKFAAKTIKQVKGLVQAAKNKIGDVLDSVTGKIDRMSDEYDAFTFEDRMRRVTEEEKAAKERGEKVPEQDYRTRYMSLTEELKVKLASIRQNIKRREDIEKALSELEGNSASTVELKNGTGEKIEREEWEGKVSTLGSDSDLANLLIDIGTGLIPGNNPLVSAAGHLAKMGSEAGRVDKYRKRKDLMDAITSTSKDQLIKRVSRYAKDNAQLREMQAGFDVAIHIFGAAEGIGKATGNAAIAAGASVLGNITTGVKTLASSSKRRSGVKNGIKDMLGGKEGYYGLKAKYKMHAPEMRRAVRDALGVASSEDAVTADKWELSHLMNERARAGAMDRETERMVAEAGGTSEKQFDELQGAGAKIKRRNANRRLRMTG